MRFKVGIVGCGSFSRFVHGPSHRRLSLLDPEIVLAGCCDMDRERAEAYRRDFGFLQTYDDLDAMFDAEKLDAAFVVVAPQHTFGVTQRVLERGVPLFVEKPPGLDFHELSELISLSRKAGVPTQVGFNRRHMPLIRAAKKILAEEFPEIFQINYQMARFDRHEPDFSTTAIHAIDAALHLAGSPYREVELNYQEVGQGTTRATNVYLEAACLSGTRVHLGIQPVAGLVSETVSIHGYGRSLIADFGETDAKMPDRLRYYKENRLETHQILENPHFEERYGFLQETEAFHRSIRSGGTPSPTLAESLQQVVLMEAIRHRTPSVVFPSEGTSLASPDQRPAAAGPASSLSLPRRLGPLGKG